MKKTWPIKSTETLPDGSIKETIDTGAFVKTTVRTKGKLRSHVFMDPRKKIVGTDLAQFTYPDDIGAIADGIKANVEAAFAAGERVDGAEELLELIDELKTLLAGNATSQAASCAYRIGVIYTQLQVHDQLEPMVQKHRNRITTGAIGASARAVLWVTSECLWTRKPKVGEAWKRYKEECKRWKGRPNPPFPLGVKESSFRRAFSRHAKHFWDTRRAPNSK